jgi:leucyl/phenylalanyl-tRNA--protein transferase
LPIVELSDEILFPPAHMANSEGLLAVGGDLRYERLMAAYHQGIFPWYGEDTPILWWSPDPRFVLYPGKLKVSKSMKQVLNKGRFNITFDTAFEQVIRSCKTTPRPDQDGTWITEEVVESFLLAHHKGTGHSVEVWENGKLVGGLYGLCIGKVFYGESMFSSVSNASKAGFITLVREMKKRGIELIDCQVYTRHLESLGAELINRDRFLAQLEVLLDFETPIGPWTNWIG